MGGWSATRARLVITAAIVVTAACVTVAVARPSDALVIAGLYAPSAVGVVLIWWTSLHTWRRAARRPRRFVVDDGRAFLLLPDRPTVRAVAMVLACAFPIGQVITRVRGGGFDAIDWATAAIGAVVAGLAILHTVFLWRGVPRPLVIVTPAGVTAAGFFGSVHAPWEAFRSDYASWPNRRMDLALPVYDRDSVQVRGRRPYGVTLPDTSEPFTVPAAWGTNPWWASQALATYWKRMRGHPAIGTAGEHAMLVATLSRYDDEIDEQLSRFR